MGEKPEHILALAGIRGYGFLAIFVAHYLTELIFVHRANTWVNGVYYVGHLAWLALPAFFVLSGYLIGGILFRSRDRKGFFKVFYARRALRVLPVYYITILVVAGVDLAHGIHLDYRYWAHLIYIQNFMPGYSHTAYPPNNQVIHLWSMALEEQFYLTWPLVVWFAKDRKTLLKVTLSICALCWMIRLIAPWIHISPTRGYYATPTRVDAILFGVALALVADHEIYKRYQYLAKYVAIIGSILWLLTFINHPDYPDNYYRLVLDCSFGNFIVLAVIVAALEEGSAFARFLSVRWVCWLGQMSYALYTFHFTYHAWFLNSLRPMLERYIAEPGAFILTLTLALALTIALGMLSLRFVELPALSLKRYFTYGRESLDPSNAQQADKEISLSRPAAQDAPDVPAELTEAHSAVSKREFGAAGLLH